MIIAGTPDQVIGRLKYLIEHTRPGIMGIWGNEGRCPPPIVAAASSCW